MPKDVNNGESTKKKANEARNRPFFAAVQIRKPLKNIRVPPWGGGPGGVGVAPDGKEHDIGEHVRVAHRESEAPAVGGGGRGAEGERRDKRASAAARGGGVDTTDVKPRRRKKMNMKTRTQQFG